MANKNHDLSNLDIEKDTLLNELLALQSAGIWIIDTELRTTYASQTLHKILGYKAGTMIGKSIFDFADSENRVILRNNIKKSQQQQHGQQYQLTLKAAGGGRVRVMMSSSPLRDRTRKTIGSYAIVSEIEDLNRQVTENKKFQDMFYRHSAIMLLIDQKKGGAIIDANQSALDFYGYTRKNLLKKKITDLNMLTAAEIQKEMQAAAKEERNYFQFKHKLKSGKVREVEVHSTPMQYNNQNLLFSIIHDITERKQFEQQLKQINQNLEKKIEKEINQRRKNEQMMIQQSKLNSMGQMMQMIGHQWRQPLNVISLLAHDILDVYHENQLTDEYIEDTIARIAKFTQNMSDTIDHFSEIAKPSEHKSLFSLNKAMDICLTLWKPRLEQAGIEMKVYASSLLNIYGHLNEFRQVIIAIIENAYEALTQNENTEKPASRQSGKKVIHIKIKSTETSVTIVIANNGPPVEKQYLPQLFDPYFTTKTSGLGSGMSLYMSKIIIESHMNGNLKFKNKKQGVEFIIELPLML